MDFATALAVEAWVLWSIGIFLVGCRIASRIIILGTWRKFQPDDWIMLFTVLTFTGAVVSTMQVANNGSNYLPEGAAELLTPDEVVSAIYGSKMTLVLEEFTLFTTWQIKACFLIMYSRLTLGLRQNLAVKILAGYCVVGFVVTQILYLAVWCRPIEQYWAVPVVNSQCASYYNHMITATVFNVSSDLMMLMIPIPLLLGAQLPLKRKLILCGVFSLGIFVILAAVLNRYYNFSIPFSPIFLNWYVGELSTAVFVANIPLCWPLLRRVFRLGTFGGKNSNSPLGYNGAHSRAQLGHTYGKGGTGLGGSRHDGRGVQRLHSGDETMIGFSESEERINKPEWSVGNTNIKLSPLDGKVGYHSEVHAVSRDYDGTDVEDGVERPSRDGRNRHHDADAGITKTVQVTQYTL